MNDILRTFLLHLFEQNIDKVLQHLSKNYIPVINITDINLITSLCHIFQSLFTINNGINFNI